MADETTETPQEGATESRASTRETPQAGNDTPQAGEPTTDTFSREYVQQLRRSENETRRKLREAEARLEALETEKLTEKERAERERDDFKAKYETAIAEITTRDRREMQRRAAGSVFTEAADVAEFAPRLMGETLEEMEADAKRIAKRMVRPFSENRGNGSGSSGDPLTRVRQQAEAEREKQRQATSTTSLEERLGLSPAR